VDRGSSPDCQFAFGRYCIFGFSFEVLALLFAMDVCILL